MSVVVPPRKKWSVTRIAQQKGKEPLVCLTAYTTQMARLLDPHANLLLVGDSLGMVIYGLSSTLGVKLDWMIDHGAAVVRGADSACVVVDLPFGTYQESPEIAYRTAAQVMAQTGCDAVKLEGGVEMAPAIRFLVERGIPVFGHVGLQPQSVQAYGGFGARGKSLDDAEQIVRDAVAVAEAGAFAIVVEGVMETVGEAVTAASPVPTVGIGASAACDGQILVTDDMLGLFTEFTPKFVRKYAALAETVDDAVCRYAADVRARRFPGPDETYRPKS